MKITCEYKTYTVNIEKEDNEYLNNYFCTIYGNVLSSPKLIYEEKLEVLLLHYKLHVDSFNTGIVSPYMNLTIEHKDQVLSVWRYDPNINNVIFYTANYHFSPKEEDSLEKLVKEFMEFANTVGLKSDTLEINGKEYKISKTKGNYTCYVNRLHSVVEGKTLDEFKENLEKTEASMIEFANK